MWEVAFSILNMVWDFVLQQQMLLLWSQTKLKDPENMYFMYYAQLNSTYVCSWEHTFLCSWEQYVMLGGERVHEQVQVSMESRDTPELGWGDVIHRRWSSAIQKSILVWTASTLLRPFHLGHDVCSTLPKLQKVVYCVSVFTPFTLSVN